MTYAQVILPLPLQGGFTYEVPPEAERQLRIGARVIVPFGRRKFYTGIVDSVSDRKPEGYELKAIAAVLDSGSPIIKRPQIQLWNWIADYYLATVGEVMKAALPAGLKVESETFVEPVPDFEEDPQARLSEREVVVLQTLDHAAKRLTVADIEKLTGFTGVNALIGRMIDKKAVAVSEKLVERYAPRRETYVRMAFGHGDTEALHRAFDAVASARRQEAALLALTDMSGIMRGEPSEVAVKALCERADINLPILKALQQKSIVEIYRKEIGRFRYNGLVTASLPTLSDPQREALNAIHASWRDKNVTLLRGVTSSGKTELYIHLIDFVLRQRRQVLYLVPEIALTTQLTERLQRVFGDKVVIYHSKFTDNERVDIWKRLLCSDEPCVVIGARSSVLLPFGPLGLVIIDEEHETSYKQQDPAPRYNARDTAMVLARMHGAKTLLGSATPSVETYYKATTGRFGLVELTERYGAAVLPEVNVVDMKRARLRGEVKGPLSADASLTVADATANGGQAIVFINRRGFAPVAECSSCGYSPKCEHCDVTLTYHKRIDRLVCHYCGSQYPLPTVCPACKEPAIEVLGFGTERVEDEVGAAFGGATTLRMDLDTTRSKDSYQQIINDFSGRKADILIGTQMVTKGLDFAGVSAVVILSADALLNVPDFRASERAFNMMEQVAGRAGRRGTPGHVIIQSYQPAHPVLPYVASHDYLGFYNYEIEERRKFLYPPFTRIIYIYIKHRDPREVDSIAVAYTHALRQLFGNRVYGPEEPHVGRIQQLYIRKIMLKIETEASMTKVRTILRDLYERMHSVPGSPIRSAQIYYDVDPM
ncbi:replication restart helicase PriA [Paramuribaculum intestinale]|uniref:replication restart helicase PriA n=1 Tax=Paramuribaculum intestinale TaxID=2094151 RepID=UPI00272A749D|nr:primosomal protein N' [Paramuribaculum intestinale]